MAAQPIFLPGKFRGQKSPWGHKEPDMTEWLTYRHTCKCPFFTHVQTHEHIHTDRQYENVLYYKKYFHETREEFLPLSFFFFTLADDIILFDDFRWENTWNIQKAIDSIIMHTYPILGAQINKWISLSTVQASYISLSDFYYSPFFTILNLMIIIDLYIFMHFLYIFVFQKCI